MVNFQDAFKRCLLHPTNILKIKEQGLRPFMESPCENQKIENTLPPTKYMDNVSSNQFREMDVVFFLFWLKAVATTPTKCYRSKCMMKVQKKKD